MLPGFRIYLCACHVRLANMGYLTFGLISFYVYWLHLCFLFNSEQYGIIFIISSILSCREFLVLASKTVRPEQNYELHITLYRLHYPEITVKAVLSRDGAEYASGSVFFTSMGTKSIQLQVNYWKQMILSKVGWTIAETWPEDFDYWTISLRSLHEKEFEKKASVDVFGQVFPSKFVGWKSGAWR